MVYQNQRQLFAVGLGWAHINLLLPTSITVTGEQVKFYRAKTLSHHSLMLK